MNNQNVLTSWIVSSEERVFENDLPKEGITKLKALINEPVSFSLAYRSFLPIPPNGRVADVPFSVSVNSDTLPASVYKVSFVPFSAAFCEDGKGKTGACPDLLLPRISSSELIHLGDRSVPYYEKGERVLLNASSRETQSVFVTLNEKGEALAAGEHSVCVRIVSLMSGEELARHEIKVHLIDALLPENELLYTNWVHYDCIAEDHGLAVWSDEYFDVLGKYLKNASLHGMTTVLLPAFTPPLDTAVGLERMNVQLLGVREAGEGYEFDLSLIRRFIRVAKENGIRYFEHCHLFSQWGAENAITVYGERNGENVKIFDCNTPASSPKYRTFLRSYLAAFLALAKEEGVERDLLFHLSDEPFVPNLESYRAARDAVMDILDSHRVGDALSDYVFYEKGLCPLPIVDMERAAEFDGRCDNLMLYYTGGEPTAGMSNRLLTDAPPRTRILGLHLFRYHAKGFLHWAYNFTYGRMSQGHFDPAKEPCFYKNIPGVTYLVYPNRENILYSSLREKGMRSAMNDYRALKLLESFIGFDATLALCEASLGEKVDFLTIPKSAEAMLALREAINEAIESHIK